MAYEHQKIERKWQKQWERESFWQAKDFSKKKKFYLLVEFPYPSGQGLHVGHCRSYTALDIVARKRRMEGWNVLFPMGWDAFGLPTENYAVKTGIRPEKATKDNTDNFRRQLKGLGFSFDWTREINTTDPQYYKWTQWIFVQLFKKGLAYKAKIPINWCPSCKIGLANEEVVEGRCERCGAKVAKKEKEQWLLKITKYADRLIEGLKKVDYPERVVLLQKDWIGRSEGYEVEFPLSGSKQSIEVFTTRIDTIFGATYLVLSPEHPLLREDVLKIGNYAAVKKYIERAKSKSDLERTALAKEKTGIELQGVKARNPATGKEIPLFVADYVLPGYGTGAVMAVPAHDQRDYEFARRYGLKAIKVIDSKDALDVYKGEGKLINSGKFNGLPSEKARQKIAQWLKAKKKVNYRLKDWIFSRQRYWGEPIPLVFCPACKARIEAGQGGRLNAGEALNPGWAVVDEKELPVKLPPVKDYKPTEEGDSPLAKIKNWRETKCPRCGGSAYRETDVMPNWAGSNWYFLRYCDPRNNKSLADPKKLKYWLAPPAQSPQGAGGVDWYNGGMEHTTLHLLYSRFIYKFLWDIGAVPREVGDEPYRRRTAHGVILGEGGVKMSKSKGNVVNPEEVAAEYGADALRTYEMFMGPFEQMIAWDTNGLKGVRRFLERVWQLAAKVEAGNSAPDKILEGILHRTIKKVSADIEKLKFNTAVAALMVLSGEMEKRRKICRSVWEKFLLILSPFAPHLAEELWRKLGKKKSIFQEQWPAYSERAAAVKEIILVVQVNGKVRDKIKAKAGLSKEEAEKIALSSAKVRKSIGEAKVKKSFFVPDKLINFVV